MSMNKTYNIFGPKMTSKSPRSSPTGNTESTLRFLSINRVVNKLLLSVCP